MWVHALLFKNNRFGERVCVLVFALYMKPRKPLFWPHRFCFSMRRVVSANKLRI